LSSGVLRARPVHLARTTTSALALVPPVGATISLS
jgi:hypothetical protein